MAATEADLPLVTERITEWLGSDDEWTRHIAADAARVVLACDATRIVALGEPLCTSIRGPDSGCWGYPHPAGAALKALAVAWRAEPTTTRSIVEAAAARASAETKAELARIPWMIRMSPDEPADTITEALGFLVQRASGDWGDEAADHAVDTLESVARHVPAIVDHVDALIGHVLALCSPEAPPVIDPAIPDSIASISEKSLTVQGKM